MINFTDHIKWQVNLLLRKYAIVPAVFSDGDWLELVGWDPISASRSTVAGLAVTGGDRGEGSVTGWAAGIAGRATLECLDAGRCNGCGVWLADAGVIAG